MKIDEQEDIHLALFLNRLGKEEIRMWSNKHRSAGKNKW